MKFGTIAGVLSLALLSSAAYGSQFGSQGQLNVGVDRVFGYAKSTTKTTTDVPGVGSTSDETTNKSFGILGNTAVSPMSTPRFALDFFVAPSVSVGGALTYVDGDSVATFLLAPRAGYAAMFTDQIGIWPRGGLTYFNRSIDGADGSRHNLAITAEAPFVFRATDGLAFLVGPTVDLGILGSGPGTDDPTVKTTDIGLQVGIVGNL